MKNTTLRYALLTLTLGLFTLASCKKDPQPEPEVDQEEFDAAIIQYILLNEHGSETTDTLTINFDKQGHPSPHHVHLLADHNYRSLITLFYKGQSINEEIREDGNAHQFFFIPSENGVIDNFEYKDFDNNGRGIGLDGIISFSHEGGAADLKVVLRHGLNKSHEAAQTWNNPDYQNAGGADDLNIEFEIHVVNEGEGHDHD